MTQPTRQEAPLMVPANTWSEEDNDPFSCTFSPETYFEDKKPGNGFIARLFANFLRDGFAKKPKDPLKESVRADLVRLEELRRLDKLGVLSASEDKEYRELQESLSRD